VLFVQLETLSGCSARPPVEAEASDVDVAAPSPAEQQVDGIPPQRTPATLRRAAGRWDSTPAHPCDTQT
jgi:hypothetical protein